MKRKLIACLWDGKDLPDYSAGIYGPSDVARLYQGAKRFLPGAELHVLADQKYAPHLHSRKEHLGEEIQVHRLDESLGFGGWSYMMQAFRGGQPWSPGGEERAVLIGLDSILTGDCTWLFEWAEADIGLPPATYRPNTVNNAVTSFNQAGALLAWQTFMRDLARDQLSDYLLKGQFSEMLLLRELWRKHGWPRLDEERQRLLSYPVDIRRGRNDLSGVSVVYFHGRLKPRDLRRDEDAELLRLWRLRKEGPGDVHVEDGAGLSDP